MNARTGRPPEPVAPDAELEDWQDQPWPDGMREDDGSHPVDDGAEDSRLPRIKVGTGPQTIREVERALNAGAVPDLYVTDGRLVHIEKVSGSARQQAGEKNQPLPVEPAAVDAARLAGLLAHHTFTYKMRGRSGEKGGSEVYEEETTPAREALGAVLASRYWPDLPALRGIVGNPVLRPDGTLLQNEGYDAATGLYLVKKVNLPPVLERPEPAAVKGALTFLREKLLLDFPWKSAADQANYLGFLVTPILRRYLHSLIPLAAVSATSPSSGKTILTEALGALYGQTILTWTHNDDELRKTITSVLADPVGTVMFDNLGEGAVVDSPVLARLITGETWSDRLLRLNATAHFVNDRVWIVNGNNISLGGDISSRSVPVFLDPNMPRPEERSGFAIPNLDTRIRTPSLQQRILWSLLILVVDWVRAGAPRSQHAPMRQFTPWAQGVGGFLAHHGIEGFLANLDDVRGIDEEDAWWQAFYTQWREMYADRWLTANELLKDADPNAFGGSDQWKGLFPTDHRGRSLNTRSLGKKLAAQAGRFRGHLVLRTRQDPHTKIYTFHVERYEE